MGVRTSDIDTAASGATPAPRGSSHQDAGSDEISIQGLAGVATSAQKVEVSKAGSSTGTRPEINFIEGSNVTIVTADDAGNDRVNVTISSTAGGDVSGPGASTNDRIAVWNGTGGDTLKDSSKAIGDVVVGPASVTDGRVVAFDGTTGKLVKQDTRLATHLVAANTLSSTSGNVPQYSGTSGVLITDSGYPAGQADKIKTSGGSVTISGTAPSANQVLTASSSSAASWQTPAAGVTLTSSAPADVTKATAAVGVATDAARADHKHNVSTAAASSLTVGGSNAEGSATSLARSDHTHALPAFGSSSGTFTEGNDSRLSNDRTASGIRTATTVVSVSSASAPSAGQVLQASSSTAASWVTPATTLGTNNPNSVSVGGSPSVGVATAVSREDHVHVVSTGTPTDITMGASASAGSANSVARSDHTHGAPAFGTGSGTVCQGNDSRLSNDRTASGIRTATTTVSVSSATAPSANQVLAAINSTSAQWVTPSFTAAAHASSHQDGGADEIDVTGLTGVLGTAQVADKIKTSGTAVSISSTSPSAGQVLQASSATAASWTTPGPYRPTIVNVTGVGSASPAVNSLVLVDVSGSAVTINLPAGHVAGDQMIVKAITTGNAITVDANSTEQIDGSATYTTATDYECVTLISNGVKWFVIA